MHFWNTYCYVIQLGDSAFVRYILAPYVGPVSVVKFVVLSILSLFIVVEQPEASLPA